MNTTEIENSATPLDVPAHLAAFWKEDSQQELRELASWAKAHPKASPAQVAEYRHAVRLALAQRAEQRDRRSGERVAALEAAATCPACKTPRAMRVARVSFPKFESDRVDRPALATSIAEIQALEMGRKLNPRKDDDEGERIPTIYRAESEGQLIDRPKSLGGPLYVCSRCRPVVEAALIRAMREEVVGGASRGELADAFVARLVAERRSAAT